MANPIAETPTIDITNCVTTKNNRFIVKRNLKMYCTYIYPLFD